MKNKNLSSKIFDIFNILFMILVIIITLYPFLYIFSMSVSSSSAVMAEKVTLLPIGFNLKAYKLIVEHPNFLQGYKNTIIYTVLGTTIAMLETIICAYPLSKKHLKGRNFVMGMAMFAMLFNGGLIPRFLLINNLGLIDSIWAIILPMAISPWNMIIMRTFFQGIPEELEEAARIDGLNPIQILIRIVLPLSKPILATIGLFYAVQFWNEWFWPMLLLNDHMKLPITLFLRNIVMGAELAAKDGVASEVSVPATLKSATIMTVTLPILCVYPFVQKYFVKGVMIGAVKG